MSQKGKSIQVIRWSVCRGVLGAFLLLSFLANNACEDSDHDAERRVPLVPATTTVESLDGVLSLDLDSDLIVYRFEQAVMVSREGQALRFYVSHLPEPSVIRNLGAFKEALIGLGWEPTAERHYKLAAQLRAARGGTSVQRVCWVVTRNGRGLMCDGFAEP